MKKQTGVLPVVALAAALLTGIAYAQEKKDDAVVVKKGDNLVEVTVSGMGMDKDSAVNDARRKAVERGAGTFIYSQSETKDFTLIRDTVLARAAGYVQSYELVGDPRTSDDGVWTVKIKAVVSLKGVEDTWGVVKNLLEQKGHPKLMVFINERVDKEPAEESTVQTKIEKLLLDSGFQLVNRKQYSEIEKKDAAAAVAEDKPAKLQALAKKFGAQLFISGEVTAESAGTQVAYGVTLERYGCSGKVKAYNSDDANMLASETAEGFSADEAKVNAANKSLKVLGDKLAPVVLNDILIKWLDSMTGGGAVKLEVENVTFKQATQLAEGLKNIKEIKAVPDPEFHNKIAEYNIQCTVTAKELAKLLVKIDGLDVTDVTQNTIKCTYAPPK
ncbi:MAG: hypothetical protein ACE15C_12595 [Phycisphaerae bacterium]